LKRDFQASEEVYLRIRAEMFRELLKWRHYLKYLIEASEKVLGENAEIYVFGSAIEGKLTADSDVDVAIVLPQVPSSGAERAKVIDRIFRYMEERGVPWWYPFEIHLVTREEMEVLKRGGAKFYNAKELVK